MSAVSYFKLQLNFDSLKFDAWIFKQKIRQK